MSDRLPQDIPAEQSALGAMLLSRRAIDDLADTLNPADFYRPAHETICRAIYALHNDGQPVDVITLAQALGADIARAGGHTYLHELIGNVPTVSSATYYADSIRAHALRRRLVEAGTRIVQMANGSHDADQTADDALAILETAATTTGQATEHHAADLLDQALDAIDPATPQPTGGVPTGWPEVDDILLPLMPGQLVVIGGRPAIGKALALDTPIPTPTGWTTQGELTPGDYVLGDDGRPTRVLAVTETWLDRPCYRVSFNDGTSIVADAEHEWVTSTRSARRAATPPLGIEPPRTSKYARDQRHLSEKPGIVTTRGIAESLRTGSDRRLNHSIDLAKPIDLPDADLPIPPYTLGVWLGDGSSWHGSFTSADPEIPDNVRADGYTVTKHSSKYSYGVLGLHVQVRESGLRRNKHIPMAYLRASERQRRELLAGLLDTDGTVSRGNGSPQFAVCDARLAMGALELIRSLGYRASYSTKTVKGRSPKTSTCYTISFTTTEPLFKLTRKAKLQSTTMTDRARRIYITGAEPVPSVPVRCIMVDNESHLYLAGTGFTPTHNSVVGLDLARHTALRLDQPAVILSLEMSRDEVMQRLLASEARVSLTHLRMRTLDDGAWHRIAQATNRIREAPLWIDDSSHADLPHLRAIVRRRKPAVTVVDYAQLVHTEKAESRQQAVAALMRGFKLLAKRERTCVIALSQLNRGAAHRANAKPIITDLRETGESEQAADVVILLHREEGRPDVMQLEIAKQRNGPQGEALLAFQGHYSRAQTLMTRVA